MTFKEFTLVLKAERIDKNLTQAELAKRVPMNRTRYSRIETGKLEPSFFELTRIASILNLDLNILKMEEKKSKPFYDFD